MVGINTAIFSRSGGSDGIGFAIPVNLAKTVITQLAEHGRVVRASLGVTIQPVTEALAKGMSLPDTKGALVGSVVEGSPAMKAGLQAGDVIVEYDGKPIAKSEDLPRLVAGTEIGRDGDGEGDARGQGHDHAGDGGPARRAGHPRSRRHAGQGQARPVGGEPDAPSRRGPSASVSGRAWSCARCSRTARRPTPASSPAT